MMMLSGPSSIQTEERNRWSRGSAEVQTRQEQARRGTPWEVPVPKKVRRIDSDSAGHGGWRPSFGLFGRRERKIFAIFPESSAIYVESC